MTDDGHVPEYEIRTAFYRAMSRMYRTEVPLYGELLSIVEDVNARVLGADPALVEALDRHGELERLGHERHGAVRVGTAAELSMMRRAFAVMGMYPVGYYDLSVAGVPVHSTAFRPVVAASLNRNPFRVFTSLLRLELVEDPELRAAAGRLLARRTVFTEDAVTLVERFERDGGLDAESAAAFVAAVLETFRWHGDTAVDAHTYDRLHRVHRLVADVTCFRGPHINHLTPRTLDIDAAQSEMLARGVEAKEVIEGPPRRQVGILLRQTSFRALEERIRFAGGGRPGTHTARFGEIEQRGLALTPAGHELYDRLLAEARAGGAAQDGGYEDRLRRAFERFPDDVDTLRRRRLGYFTYRVVEGARIPPGVDSADIDALVASGVVEVSPVVYEDFLPVSAAGVFRSNLGDTPRYDYSVSPDRAAFEEALGAEVADPFTLYRRTQEDSLAVVRAILTPATRPALEPPG